VATMKLMPSKALETATLSLSLSIRAPVGEPGGVSFCGNFESQMKGAVETEHSLLN